jgi:protein involved in polysaccharide export with SLBB domain
MSATTMSISCNKILRFAVIAAFCTFALGACSTASDSHGDQPGTRDVQRAAMVSPEQCMKNGARFQAASLDTSGYRIQPGDQLAIDFYLNSEFNDNVSVQPDGRIVLRLVGPLQAAGLSSGQLSAEVNQAYSQELKNPSATVHVQNMPSRQIFVEGQVNHPGAFSLQPGMTASQAIADAGGQTDEAELSNVVLIRRDACGRPDGSKIDLASATTTPDKGDDVMLMPHDTLVVPRSRIANMDLWVKQYIRDMLPVQPYLSPAIP